MFTAKFSLKRYFFDRDLVKDAVDKKTRKDLSKYGAFVRTRAMHSLRRRKSPSAPGKPPSVHSRDKVANLRNIWFAYDPSSRSVVVGPVKLNQINFSVSGNQTTVPELHEVGGDVAIREWRFKNLERLAGDPVWQRFVTTRKFTNEWRRADLRWHNASRHRPGRYLSQLGREYRVRKAEYPPRPFMKPAFDRERPNFPEAFRGGLTGRAT